MLAALLDGGQAEGRAIAQRLLALQDLRVAEHRVQRRAQLVAHLGEEIALRAVRHLGAVARDDELGVGSLDPFLRLLEGAAVLADPDRAFGRIVLVLHIADQVDPEVRAILMPHEQLHLERLALRQQRCGDLAERLVFVVAAVQHARRQADGLLAVEAEQLGELRVVANDVPLAGEDDADWRVAHDRFHLAQGMVQRLLGLLRIGDVLDDPHRALVGLRRVDRLAVEAAPHGRAVSLLVQPLGVERLAGREQRARLAADALVALRVRIDHAARPAHQLFGRAVAEDFGRAAVAMLEHAIAREQDADRRVVEDRRQFVARLLQRLFGDLALRVVFEDPDRAVARVVLVLHVADQARPEVAAVLATHEQLGVERSPGGQQRRGDRADRCVFVVGAIEHASRLLDAAVVAEAEHLAELGVVAGDAPVLRQHDADRRVLHDRAHQARGLAQVLRGLLGLGDVFDDPHRAGFGVGRVDRLAVDVAPDVAAVGAAQQPVDVEEAAGRQQRGRFDAESIEAVGIRKQPNRRLARQLLGRRVAEDVGHALVATLDHAVAGEDDARRCVVEDRRQLEQRALRACRLIGRGRSG